MTLKPKYLLLCFIILVLIGLGVYAFSIRDRIALYANSKLHPPLSLPSYRMEGPPPPTPNVDLGEISFYLELSPQASITVSRIGVMLKDAGKSLIFRQPFVDVEEPLPPEPGKSNQSIRAQYGTLTRAAIAALAQDIDLSILFGSTETYERQLALFKIRQGFANLYNTSSIYTSPTLVALITENTEIQSISIWWSTSEGPTDNQTSNYINISYQGDTSDGKWRDQLIRSLVVHGKSESITPEEMAARLEKIKQPTKTSP